MRIDVSFAFDAAKRLRVGILQDFGRDTAFAFDAEFLATGLNPAPFRLPLRPGWQTYDRSGNMQTFGLFEDSLPDGWGRRLIDAYYLRKCGRRPSVLERLACVGAHGMGALAPFYDFTGSEGPNGWQTLSVSGEGRDPGIADLRRLADDVGLRPADAADILDRTRLAVCDEE